MMTKPLSVARPLRVFCTDDNSLVTEAVRMHIEQEPGFRWVGSAETADDMLAKAEEIRMRHLCPDIVLLDIDMPGRDAFEAIEIEDRYANPDALPPPHSVLSRHLIDAEGQPTRAALDRTLAFFREQLGG